MNCCLLSFVMLFAAISYTSAEYQWDKFAACQAKRQSPIDIEDSVTIMDKKLEFITKNWSKDNVKMNLTNNNHTVQVTLINAAAEGLSTEFEGQTYEPAQFHFHWGKVSYGKSDAVKGSEHKINGKSYAAELHIVHFNKKYGNIGASLPHGDGLLVVGVFIESGASNPAMADVTSHLHKVSTICDGPETRVCKGGVSVHLSLSQLLPKDGLQAFYHYDGSLTTPPCSEAVQWIVVRTPITMDEAQFSEFKSLHSTESGSEKTKYMSGNYRETQKLWGRNITRNFVPEEQTSSGVAVIPATFISLLAVVVTVKVFLY